MADHESLGKARLDLTADTAEFDRNIGTARRTAEGLGDKLGDIAGLADVAQHALDRIKLEASHAAESRASAEGILSGVHGISDASRTAAIELDRVKLSSLQADETRAEAFKMDRALDGVSRNAEQARRRLEEVKLAGAGGPGLFGVGRGVLLPAGIGLGALALPAVAPAAAGLLASIPVLASVGAGALGTLALAFQGVGKAIGGDKKAFDDLAPAAQKFVLTVRSLDGFFDRLKGAAAASVFPGLTAGLKAALSPGTVDAIFTAVTELGRALGQVGAEFGRYFGSSEFQKIFGPLMQSAARNIGVLGDAALHLFDGLGVLGRAAIPFTNWLNSAIDRSAKLADSWLHTKAASGGLAHAMNEARTSLSLVAKLVGALLHVVGALGQALYPVSKIALRDLTGALNYLAGVIHHNQREIRSIVGGALAALTATVKGLVPIVRVLARVITTVAHAVGGWKVVFAGLLALKFGLILNGWTKALEKLIFGTAATGGAEATGGLLGATRAMRGLAVSALELAGPFLAAAAAVYGLDKALAKLTGFDALKKVWGSAGWFADNAGGDIHKGKNPWPVGTAAYDEWEAGYRGLKAGTAKDSLGAKYNVDPTSRYYRQGERAARQPHHHDAGHPRHHKTSPPSPSAADVFGTPPPFTSNTGGSGSGGSRSAVPQSALSLEALARRQDQEAAALHYAGQAARRHLDQEITDLQKADLILEEKLKRAHGKKRTDLYNALTANLKKIAEARKRITDAITKGRQADLNFALDQAKAAAGKALEGSKAWERAISAEEKALKAEIRYWDKRAHNDKLSKDARDAALRKEISYERQLKELLTQRNQAVAANEAQFIQSFVDIQNTFGPNAAGYPGGAGPSGKTDTHLHDLKNEARESNRHLKAIRTSTRFPGSRAGYEAAMAVSG